MSVETGDAGPVEHPGGRDEMGVDVTYSSRERFWLWKLAVFGFVGLNGAFAYGVLFQPDSLRAALANPVAVAFMAEALVLVGVLAYLFARWGASRLAWGWFVLLSLLGGLAFAIPVVLLLPNRGGGAAAAAAREDGA